MNVSPRVVGGGAPAWRPPVSGRVTWVVSLNWSQKVFEFGRGYVEGILTSDRYISMRLPQRLLVLAPWMERAHLSAERRGVSVEELH